MRIILLQLSIYFLWQLDTSKAGILQPRPSETRDQLSLDGLWYFTTNENFSQSVDQANDMEINLMTVPSSYNDITTNAAIRDHVGSVWYYRTFFVPESWKNKKVWIRFGSVCQKANVTVNGNHVTYHQFGHYPFASEISPVLHFGKENNITVEVDNIADQFSIPQGSVMTEITGVKQHTYTYDYFNYAGIDRPVVLYTTSNVAYLDDITIKTRVNGSSGIVDYTLAIAGSSSTTHKVIVLDKYGEEVVASSSQEMSEQLAIPNATLWWPYLMYDNPGHMYTLKVNVYEGETLVDQYNQPFGVREITYDNTSVKINGKNIYIRGFGRHEDSDIRGKGLDLALVLRDYNLIKWIGANTYRTSHYPYAEEIMDLADQLGIMIIDEVPAINLDNYSEELLENWKRCLTDLYNRDKNRPAVIMWSIANEPRSQQKVADEYFRNAAAHIKSYDISRPITVCNMYTFNEDYSGSHIDVLGVNRYQAWYNNVGQLDAIYTYLTDEARGWHQLHNKPVLITEYGADSQEGLHFLPTYIWSEEYQNDLMEEHFRAFDELRNEGWMIGEMIWNFADFKTMQEIRRVGGNKKGLFTRNRQPKSAAFLMRRRYWALAKALDNATVPFDVDKYILGQGDNRSLKAEL